MPQSKPRKAANKREPAHIKISRELGTAIVTEHYAPGTILPGEIEIAEQFGVSRSVVREALRMLSARGLIVSKPKVGTRVQPRAAWHLLDPIVLEWSFGSVPSREFVRSLFELRMIVEPAAAELAALKKSPRQLATMGHTLEEMARHTLATTEGQVADQEFHATLLEAAGNELLVNLSASIGAAVRWTTYFKFRQNRSPRDPIEDHRALFAAIAAGNGAEARAAAITLIETAGSETEQAIGASG